MYDTEIGYEMSRQSFLPYSTRRFRIKAMRQFIRRAYFEWVLPQRNIPREMSQDRFPRLMKQRIIIRQGSNKRKVIQIS